MEKVQMSKQKKWKIPVEYKIRGTISVSSDTLKEAMETAKDEVRFVLIPDGTRHITGGAWAVTELPEAEIREIYNRGQEDD